MGVGEEEGKKLCMLGYWRRRMCCQVLALIVKRGRLVSGSV
jgi:hypothetical protein